MNANEIKYKTIKYINGTRYMTAKQVDDLGYIMCRNLGIEATLENRDYVREAVQVYFNCNFQLL